eukprot:12453524-Heterocapsa_arctica.AAC.1
MTTTIPSPPTPHRCKTLSKALDKHNIIKLQTTWRNANDLHDTHRPKDIQDHEYQDHQWITALNPAEGAVMAPQKW